MEAAEPDILTLQRRISGWTPSPTGCAPSSTSRGRPTSCSRASTPGSASLAAADRQRQAVGAAVVPEEPVSRGRLTITLDAGAGAAFICTMVIFFIEYWQGATTPAHRA